MQLPIDTEHVKFVVAGPAQPIIDFDTKASKLDATGVPLFGIPLFMAGAGLRDTIVVKVPGEPKGLIELGQVRITKLTAITWEVGNNHGVSFRAEKVELAKAAA